MRASRGRGRGRRASRAGAWARAWACVALVTRAVRGDERERAAVVALARALGHDDATVASDACEVAGVTCACDDASVGGGAS